MVVGKTGSAEVPTDPMPPEATDMIVVLKPQMYADKVGKIIQTVDGATTPQIERVSGLPQINVQYDRTRIANYGLNIEDVNNA
uniref:Uncharacterized protein n=1 Tax=Romanomermis culicivorax TaxID=13658 RepID=A0A915JIK6_ROMCU